MSDLTMKKCMPPTAETAVLEESEEYNLLLQLNAWSLDKKRVHHIRKLFQFESFRKAVKFVDKVATIAEKEDHHPDIFLSYRHVTVSLWTKKLGGLTENDYIVAAKIDALGNE